MQYSFFNFLCSALIPELCSYVSAGTAGNIHFILIGVAAVRTPPNKLSVVVFLDFNFAVIAAHMAVIALCVELGIHYVIIDKAHNRKYSFNIILHIGYFNIRNSTAGRQCLKFSLKRQLIKCVYILCYMYVIAVGNIILVGNALYYPETLLQTFCKLIGSAFKRSSVKRIIYILRFLPLCGVLVKLSHYLKSEFLAFGFGKLFAYHTVNTFPKTRISERKG